MSIRKSAVSGRFYPATKDEIVELFEDIAAHEKSNISNQFAGKEIIGGVVPHAGYVFSGYHAFHFFDAVKKSNQHFDCVVIVNPNHTGYGVEIALDENDFWQTPFGNIEIDKDFYPLLNFKVSPVAHQHEHSAEVMLPFIQHFMHSGIKILPITMSYQNVDNALTIANALFNASQYLNKKILLIASSDFSHYIEPKLGKKLDDLVIHEILKFDSQNVYKTVKDNNITACGFGPIMTLLEYAKLVAQKPVATVLRQGNSGETMPSNEVVDYVSILVCKD